MTDGRQAGALITEDLAEDRVLDVVTEWFLGRGERLQVLSARAVVPLRGNPLFRMITGTILFCASSSSSFGQDNAFLLFGGDDNQTFLGCLNCDGLVPTSICNEFGTFGSQFAKDSIWNEFGKYGSEFSQYSPWNSFTRSAPVIVDKQGKFYGHFSANQFHPRRARDHWLDQFFDAAIKQKERADVRVLLCGK